MFCRRCGAQNSDDSLFCRACGCSIAQDRNGEQWQAPININTATAQTPANNTSALKSVAKAFMILSCIISVFACLLPLCWTLPMTIHYWHAVDGHKPVGIGFKICSLLFVSLVAGVLMLCDNN